MKVLYLAGSECGAGKTALASALALRLVAAGHSVALLKPLRLVQKGSPAPGPDRDTRFFQALLPGNPSPDGWPLDVTQEQLTRDGSVPGHAAAILSQVGDRDVAVVEGLGGILGDGRVAQASGRMAQALDARVIVVARYHPGLKAADLTEAQEVFGERLLGLVLNRVTHYRRRWVVSELVPQFAATGVAILGTIPDDRRMVAPSVREMAEHLGAEHFLMPEKADPLVDYFMVGGFFLDEGAYVFSRRENKAVIARADRPDLHMAALATSTRALVLTGGQNPIQYVVYQAEQAGVAVLLTQASTLEAMERLHTLWERASVHHRERAERFAELMAASGSLEAILSSLGLNA